MKNGLLALGTFILGFVTLVLFGKFSQLSTATDNIIFYTILFGTSITTAVFWKKAIDSEGEKKAEMEYKEKKERIRKLELEYDGFVKIVDEAIEKVLPNAQKEIPIHIKKEDIGHRYLIVFEKYYNWVCKNRVTGNPDSFIIASCLMYSLIRKTMIVTDDVKNYNDKIGTMLININCKLAFDVALQIISEPTTYDMDENGEYMVIKIHPKKKIVVPEGLIEGDSLYDKIVRNLTKDYNENFEPIMQFAYMLQLIYLSCE